MRHTMSRRNRPRAATNDPRKWLPRRKLVGALLDAEDRAYGAERLLSHLEEAHQKLAFCYRLQATEPPFAFVPSPPRTSFSRQMRMSDTEKAELERLLRIQAYYAEAIQTAQAEPVGRGLR